MSDSSETPDLPPGYTGPAEHVSVCDVLDRVLNKGVVIAGEVVLSVAGIDLVYVGLHAMLTSVETALREKARHEHARTDPPGL
jgi:hypothetical protein